jgi:hypothetical protein
MSNLQHMHNPANKQPTRKQNAQYPHSTSHNHSLAQRILASRDDERTGVPQYIMLLIILLQLENQCDLLRGNGN